MDAQLRGHIRAAPSPVLDPRRPAKELLVLGVLLVVSFGIGAMVATGDNYVLVAPFGVTTLFAAVLRPTRAAMLNGAIVLSYLVLALLLHVDTMVVVSNTISLALFAVLALEYVQARQFLVHQTRRLSRREVDVQQSVARIETVVSDSAVFLFTQDADLRYTWASKEPFSFHGRSVLGLTDHDILPSEDAVRIATFKRRVLERGVADQLALSVRVGDQRRDYDLLIEPLADAEGVAVGVTGVAIDVTNHAQLLRERDDLLRRERRARAVAEQTQQELLDLVSVVVHDLGQPITVVRGTAQLIRRRLGAQSPAWLGSRLTIIENEADQMDRLVRDLADMALLEQRQLTIEPATLDLARLVRDVIDGYQATTRKHRLVVEAPDQVIGMWDSARLTQIIGNLVSNAIKYSPNGGEVRVRLRQQAEAASLSVTDQGIGISLRDQHLLFKRFSRLAQAKGTAGLGLGLYITRRLVEAHGGQITVRSTVGSGSVFTVVLPLSRGDARDGAWSSDHRHESA